MVRVHLNDMQDLHLLKIKAKNHKLRTRVAGSWSLLGHLKKTESEEVTNDAVKKKIQLLTINPHNYQ